MLPPALGGQDPLDPTPPEQTLLPHGTAVAWVLASQMVRIAIAGATQIPDLLLSGSAEGMTPSRASPAPSGQPWQPGKLLHSPHLPQGSFLSMTIWEKLSMAKEQVFSSPQTAMVQWLWAFSPVTCERQGAWVQLQLPGSRERSMAAWSVPAQPQRGQNDDHEH